MLLLLSFFLLGWIALSATALLRFQSRTAYLVSLYLFFWGALVFTAQVCSLFYQINQLTWLILQGVLALGMLGWWLRDKSPSLLGPFTQPIKLPRFAEHPLLYGFGTVVMAAYLVGAVLILAVPPNTHDAMTYHLTRIGYWLEQGSFYPWPTNNPRQTSFPFNAETGVMWTILFSGSSQLAGFIQWSAAMATGVGIYGIARKLGAGREQSIFAVFLWSTFPQIIFQSTSTQNDLTVTAFFTCAIFGLLAARDGQKRFLWLFGAGLGLALGTKTTAVLMLPGLGIGLLFLAASRKRAFLRNLLTWGAVSLAGFMLLGMLVYLQNWTVYGNPFSISGWVNEALGKESTQLSRFFTSFSLYLYRFVDFSGLPVEWSVALTNIKVYFGVRAFDRLGDLGALANSIWHGLPNYLVAHPGFWDEDLAWFGPIATLMIPLAAIVQTWKSLRQKSYLKLLPVWLAISFLLVASYLLYPTLYRGRYFTLPISLIAPILAFFYPKFKANRCWILIPLVGLSAFILVVSALMNPSKPVIAEKPLWQMTPTQLQTIKDPTVEPVVRMVDEFVPSTGSLALKTTEEGWNFVFFGDGISRRVWPVDPNLKKIDSAWLDEKKLEYLLIDPFERNFLNLPEGLEWVAEVNGWSLYHRSQNAKPPPPQAEEFLLGLSDPTGLVQVNSRLKGQVGIIQAKGLQWQIEKKDGQPFLWLGEGQSQGIWVTLVAEKPITVQLAVSVSPGPAREDSTRTLRTVYYSSGVPLTTMDRAFNQSEKIILDVQLIQGVTHVLINCLERAQFFEAGGGDTRILLVSLNGIQINPLP